MRASSSLEATEMGIIRFHCYTYHLWESGLVITYAMLMRPKKAETGIHSC